MKMRSILAACVMLTGSTPSIAAEWGQQWEQLSGPSYDCGKAQGALDLTVCTDPLLSRLELALSAAWQAALEDPDSVFEFPMMIGESPTRSARLEESQRRWLQTREDECHFDFDFHSGIDARFEAVRCLVASYANRLAELKGGKRVLDALIDTGIVELRNVELNLGSLRIDLPRTLPVVKNETPKSATPHPACIDALLQARLPSSLRRDTCRAGSDHVPLTLDSFGEDGDHVIYVPWHPNQWGQMGDRFGYRAVGELRDGRTLLHVVEESTGAGRTDAASSLAVVHGLRRGDTIMVERRIVDEGLSGFCGGGIHDVEIADADTLRLASVIPADRLVTLFDSFPEQFHGVSESERRRLRALEVSGALHVAMSNLASTCVGRVRYGYDIDSDRRIFSEVSVEVTESDRAAVEHTPALACLFDLLLDRHSEMAETFGPTEFHGLLTEFIDACGISGA